MKPFATYLLVLLALQLALPAAAQPDLSRRIGTTVAETGAPGYRFEQFRLASADGQRHYRIRVALPVGATPAGGFASAWLLDGNAALVELRTEQLARWSKAASPPVLVFLSYDNDLRIDADARAYDYTPRRPGDDTMQLDPLGGRRNGGAEAFLDLIEHAIAPKVAALAKLDPARRTLWGHSYGGVLALHALLTRPTMFGTYAAADPSLWWGDGHLLRETETLPPWPAPSPRLLLWTGTADGPERTQTTPQRDPAQLDRMRRARAAVPADAPQRLAERLRARGLKVEMQPLSGATHGQTLGASLLALLDGMAAMPTPVLEADAALASGASRIHRLALHRGDYVAGTLQSKENAPALWLDDPQGRPLRRLIEAGRPSDFMFVADSDGTYALHTRAEHGPTRYELRIERVLSISQQRPPVSAPDSPRLRDLLKQLQAGNSTDSFWKQIAKDGTPLIEQVNGQTLATFLWRGAQQGVRLFPAPTGDMEELQRLADSDVWYASYPIPADTRMTYRLAPDVPQLPEGGYAARRAVLATLQRDPLNPHVWPANAADDFARESILELPGAPAQRAVQPAGHPAGRIERHRLTSTRLGNTRDIALYRSPDFREGDPRNALLVVFDGREYQAEIPTPLILNNLRAEGAIPPVLAVFVANPDAGSRARELPCNPAFGDFLANELLPFVETKTGTLPPGTRTVLAGASYGGLASTCVALQYPQRFGNVLSQSGSFWWAPEAAAGQPQQEPEWLTRRYADAPRQPIRFWLEAGRFETGHGQSSILETNRHLRDVLRAKGYAVEHREFSGGHDWYHWRGSLADGLAALLSPIPPSPIAPAAARATPSHKDD